MTRILLIDDHQPVGRIVSLLLQEGVYGAAKLEQSLSLMEGLRAIAEDEPDLIFLDNYLGDVERFEPALERIRMATNAPVVLLTGLTMEELGLDELPAGLDGYLSKTDLSVASIESVLHRTLRNRHAGRGGTASSSV